MGFMTYALRTARKPEDIEGVLRLLTKSPSWRELVDDARPFRGEVKPTAFRLREVTQLRHHFCPFLIGRVTRERGGSLVEVRMRPSWGGVLAGVGMCACIANTGGWVHMLVLGPVVVAPFVVLMSHIFGHSAWERLKQELATELRIAPEP